MIEALLKQGRPVEAARELMRRGMSLKEAHAEVSRRCEARAWRLLPQPEHHGDEHRDYPERRADHWGQAVRPSYRVTDAPRSAEAIHD